MGKPFHPDLLRRNWDQRELSDLVQAVRDHRLDAFELAIKFLDEDPRVSDAGYIKERLWKSFVINYELDTRQLQQLYRAALGYLERPIQREFWTICHYIRRIADDDFWQRVEVRLMSPDPKIRLRASYLLEYRNGVEAGELLRQQVSAAWKQHKREMEHGSRH